MDYDRTAMPAGYDAGRGYRPEVLQGWLDIIAAALPPGPVRDILDLGCGTGRYSAGLAARFGARVIGVDPSEKMLAEARRKGGEGVEFVRGFAEAAPLEDASVDVVFMSMVFHHFTDPAQAARECHRVLRSGGAACLRAGVTERAASYAYVPFFPETPPILARSLRSAAEIRTIFLDAGFQLVHHTHPLSEVAESWPDYAERVSKRADSILVQLDDAEFELGLASLRAFASRAPDGPVTEPVDFLVFQRD